MIPSPTSVSTLVCLSAESKPETITIFEPQLNHEIIRRRPTQITKEKSQALASFNPVTSRNANKAVNALVKGLEVGEFSILVQELEKVILRLTETIQSTTSFQPFWDKETISNEKIRTVLDSLMHLIGFECHDGQYFSHDVEDVTKKTIEMKKLIQLFQNYYAPFSLEAFKPNLLHCFNTEEMMNKAYMVIKLKNVEDRLGDIKLSLTDKSMSLSKGITTLTGDFNLIYSNQDQANDISSFIERITQHVRKGENMMLLSVGATGSGKSETFFKNVGVKRDKSERIDEAIVLQIFERLIDQEVQENKDTSIIQFECQYVQIFNENLFDLLKKKDEKEETEEIKQTNLQWLQSSIKNCTRIDITDKLSIRKIMKRASTNRALLTVQDKIFERRSIYMLKCRYKIRIRDEEKTAEIVFCEMPGIEKLTPYEKESLKNMNAPNNLFTSKDEFTEFMVQTYPSRKNSMLMKMLDLNFLRNCEMMIVSHLSLDREAFEENITLFRFLKHFNETISICKQSKDQISTEQDLLSLFTKYEEIRKMLADHSYPHFSLHKTTGFLKHLEDLQEEILSKCLRLSPEQIKSILNKTSELTNIATVLEAKPRFSKALMIKETRKKGLQSLNEIISISDSITITPNQVSKSHSSPTKLSKNGNPKQKKFTVSQDPLYKYIDDLVEIDLGLYKNKLTTEGRCVVCTLKNCQSHSKPSNQISVSSKPSERLDRTINGSFREPHKIRTSLKLKDASYDAENVNPTPTRTSIQSYNVPISSKRKYRRAGSLQCEPVIVRDMNLDKSFNEVELKSRVNQSLNGSMIESENENMKSEDMNNARLAKQLKLEQYHEKKILESLRNLKEKRMQEELQKRETDMQEEKKKKYFEGQKKRLEEMRKVKVEEKKREKVEIEQREADEMKKKKKVDQYYRKIKERLVNYQQKKIAEIMLAAENMAQGIQPVQVAQIIEESEEQYESIFAGKQEGKFKAPVMGIVNKAVSCPTSAQKEIIEEDILNISKGNVSAEILDEEILEESIAA